MNWDEFWKDCKDATKKVIEPLYYCDAFQEFLKTVDKTGQGGLIKELFGSEEKYIDSPGDFWKNPEDYEYSIIYNFVAHVREDDLISLFGFFVRHPKKCFEFTYQSSTLETGEAE